MSHPWYPPSIAKNGRPKKDTNKCPLCGGKGQRKDAKTSLLRTCLVCNGVGKIPK